MRRSRFPRRRIRSSPTVCVQRTLHSEFVSPGTYCDDHILTILPSAADGAPVLAHVVRGRTRERHVGGGVRRDRHVEDEAPIFQTPRRDERAGEGGEGARL